MTTPTTGATMTRADFEEQLATANRLMDEGYDLDSIFDHEGATAKFDEAEQILDALDS